MSSCSEVRSREAWARDLQLWGAQLRTPYLDALTCPEKLGADIWSGMHAVLAPHQEMTPSLEEAA